MKKSRQTDTKIVNTLKQNQVGESVSDLRREYSMSQATFYKWRFKYGDADVIVKRLKELESENARLKKMYAEERLTSQIRLEALEGKFQHHLLARRWQAVLSLNIKHQ